MDCFEKVVDGFELLTIFPKLSILDVWQGSEYGSAADTYSSLGKKLMHLENLRAYSKTEIWRFLATVCTKKYFLITNQISKNIETS